MFCEADDIMIIINDGKQIRLFILYTVNLLVHMMDRRT